MTDFVFERKEHVQKCLIDWFIRTDRQLPWRKTYDPYHVWISEVMLQQTQMERGIDYFNRWLIRFPDVHAVAAADEHEILKNWEGLGYYARARNLHAAAKIISRDYGGVIPCDLEELLILPGIGPYTAAAVSSIACNIDIPVVDANVLRVYSRLFDIDSPVKSGNSRKKIEQIAREMLPEGRARQFNQAIMDFGGLVCLPRNPDCNSCPVAFGCLAWQRGTVADRPVITSTKKTILIEMATGILVSGRKLFIQQRKNEDIWGGLWEFPGGRLKEGETSAETVVREYSEETGFRVKVCDDIMNVTHFYTHYKVVLHCYTVTLASRAIQPRPHLTAAQDYRWLDAEDLHFYAFPAGHRKLLEYVTECCPELLSEQCAGR